MLEDRGFYVYVFFDLCGIPRYVGKGKGKRDRRKHDGPVVRLREELTESEAFDLEQLLIMVIGRGVYGPLTNKSDGGEGNSGYRYTPEQRAKVREIAKRRGISPETIAKMVASTTRGRYGPHTAESRKLMSQKKMGHEVTPATRELMRQAALRQDLTIQVAALRRANLGKKRPDAAIRIGALWRGKRLPEEHKAKLRGPRGKWFHSPDGTRYIAPDRRNIADLPGMG